MIKASNKVKMFSGKYFYGLGRRKTSVAKIRLYKGKGLLFINQKQIKNNKDRFVKALTLTNNLKNFDISVIAQGGGITGWKDSINLAVARALIEYDKSYRQILKKNGLLRRDPRKVERKKPGLKKARKAPQWQKR